MSDVYRWQAGECLVVAGPDGVVLLDPQMGVQLAERVFEEVRPGASLGTVLQVFTTAYDLWTIPPFAVALRNGDDLQVVVRGPVHVQVGSAEGEERMSGGGVSTWTERVFRRVHSFSVSWSEHPDGPSLPVTAAVLWASGISWGEAEPDQSQQLPEIAQPEAAPPAPADEVSRPPATHDARPTTDDLPTTAGDPAEPEPTAVLPLEPAGERLTGSETLPEVDWDGPPPPTAPEPDRAPANGAQNIPAGLLHGPVPGAPADSGPDAEPGGTWEGAHGGDTMASPNLGAKLLGRLLGAPADQTEPTVEAKVCAQGHPSPPHTSTCAECGQRLVGSPQRVPRPSLGLLTAPNGEVVVLTRSVIIGRSPSVGRSSTTDDPHLLTVASPNQEISRSHVEICLEGWSVLARDLGSSNGTLLVRDGDAPVKLPQTSPLQLRSGDVLDLGEGVRLSLSELP